MTLNYPQVRQQVQAMGRDAVTQAQGLAEKREKAAALLTQHAGEPEALRQKIESVVHRFDPSLRCAIPLGEKMDAAYELPPLPEPVTLLAADGSQIYLDRHAEVEFGLVNVGAISMRRGSAQTPTTSITSSLFYADALINLTNNGLSLQRDLAERQMLAELAAGLPAPVVSFTDGPLELWGARESGEEISQYEKSLEVYLEVLARLHELGVTTAGYVDKPGANPLVRLLELADTPETELPRFKKSHALQGVTDYYLLKDLLAPGERSAVFGMQSQSAARYTGDLRLHFFYLNVGRPGKPWLPRVEVPGWVATDPSRLDDLQAVLVDQCRSLGSLPYPYLIHRAHETAVVSLEEREQVTQMIALEYRRQGVPFLGQSFKQANKDSTGRTRYGA